MLLYFKQTQIKNREYDSRAVTHGDRVLLEFWVLRGQFIEVERRAVHVSRVHETVVGGRHGRRGSERLTTGPTRRPAESTIAAATG